MADSTYDLRRFISAQKQDYLTALEGSVPNSV